MKRGMTVEDIKLYRRRYIPDEKIYLKNDEILDINDEVIITKWKVLTDRHDFTHGVSCYFLKEGFKVSKFINSTGELLYWYCDIIDVEYDIENNAYTFNDLLIDVVVYKNGSVKVLDMDEIAEAIDENIIGLNLISKALRGCDKLLKIIYTGMFEDYKKYIEEI